MSKKTRTLSQADVNPYEEGLKDGLTLRSEEWDTSDYETAIYFALRGNFRGARRVALSWQEEGLEAYYDGLYDGLDGYAAKAA